MSDLEVRPLELSEIPKLVHLLNQASETKLSKGDKSWGPEPDWTEKEVIDYLDIANIYVVFKQTEIVGTVSLNTHDELWGESNERVTYIHRLATSPEFAGQGLGAKIISWVVTYAKSSGSLAVRLDCDARNKGLCKYYMDYGFKLVKRLGPTENGNYVPGLFELKV